MKPVFIIISLFLCTRLFASDTSPREALNRYFEGIDKNDKELFSNSISGSPQYLKAISKIVDVTYRLKILDDLLSKKYDLKEADRKNINDYIGSLKVDIDVLKFKVEGDNAVSIPAEGDEELAFVRSDGIWKLDILKDSTPKEVLLQTSHLNSMYDALIPLLNGLIYKIESLDAEKFTYDDAWKMVSIQMNRKLEGLNQTQDKQSVEQDAAPNH